MRTLIESKLVGTRAVCGTEFAVEDMLEREQLGDRKPTWIYTKRLCNGVPEIATEFKTKKAALHAFATDHPISF